MWGCRYLLKCDALDASEDYFSLVKVSIKICSSNKQLLLKKLMLSLHQLVLINKRLQGRFRPRSRIS